MRRHTLLPLLVVLVLALSFEASTPALARHSRTPRSSPYPSSLSSPSVPAPATAKLFGHQRTLTFLQGIINSILTSALERLPLNDTTLPIVGGRVDMTETVLKKVKFSSDDVAIVSPNQLVVDLNDVNGALDFKWEYHGPLGVKFGGTGAVTFSRTRLHTAFTFLGDLTGRPLISLKDVDVKISQLDIKLAGGGAWLWNMLLGLFKGAIVKSIETKIAQTATEEFATLIGAVMRKYPVKIPLSDWGVDMLKNVDLNLPMVVSSPSSHPDTPFLMKGDFMVAGADVWASAADNATIDPRALDRSVLPNLLPLNDLGTAPMLGLVLEDALLNSLLFTLTQNGVFNAHVDDSFIPRDSLIRLNTALFAKEWPALYKAYPENKITLDFSQRQPEGPRVQTVQNEGERITDEMNVLISVVDPRQPNPLVPVGQLLFMGNMSALFKLTQNDTGIYAFGKLSEVDLAIRVQWAALDPGTLAPTMQALLRALINKIALPIANGILSHGMQVSERTVEGFPVSNPVWSYGPGFVAMGIDVAMPFQKEVARKKYMQFTRE